MADIQALRKAAKAAGMPVAEVRTSTAAELRAYVDGQGSGGSAGSSRGRKTKSNPARGRKSRPTTKANARKATGRKSAPAKRGPGRPKGSGSKSTSRASTKAQSNGDAGRHFLTGINWGDHEAWNPRKNSPPDQIIRAVRKARGNRAKVVDALMPRVRDFVTLPKGVKPNSQAARDRLAYRVSRVMWEFALKTGQHEIATNRAAPGQGARYAGNGKSTGGRRTRSASKGSSRSGRSSAKRQTRSQGRTAGKRGPGRPKGSKNKTRR